MKVAIIGAGPAGLALAKQLQDRNINFTGFERDNDVGGVWNIDNAHSVMYESAHTISSTAMTEFSEFPMQEAYTAYISHGKMLQYLKNYADHFNLLAHFQFSCAVDSIKKTEAGKYLVHTNGALHTFTHVAIATGHASKANLPDLNLDDFSGEVLHSAEYKEPSLFKNKNVLVIGAGNSACDIACDAVSIAKSVKLSVRRGYYFIPKFLLGMPADVFGETAIKLRLPMFFRQWMNQAILRVLQGNIQTIGFPKPDHKFFETHPIINELLVYYARQGDITICADVEKTSLSGVFFKNETKHEIDIIVLATGYQPDFSLLDPSLQPDKDDLHLNLFSKRHNGLSFLGYIDPNGGVLGLLESQAKAVAKSIALNYSADKFLPLIQKNVTLNGGIRYINSSRHRFEVDHATYRREIQKQIHTFDLMT